MTDTSIHHGSRIGAYEVITLIGEGGMGRVYRARDTRLKREVAIKALPPEFALDPERSARFRREAEALAALNHPHIAGIFDLLDVGGSQFLVLELIDGETIAERLARGAMPVGEAVNVAKQIAEALEAAHTRGIVHRDLKPANIKIDSTGRVKVLDFGLAKDAASGVPQSPASASVANSPTLVTPSATMRGVILGTAGYMSPEQARGDVVGPQSDIWALGCVLYEMLTARPCFDGRTVTDIFAAVVRADPNWAALPADTPAYVRAVLRRCLQKDTVRRLHHVADVRIELEEGDDSHPATAAPVARSRPRAISMLITAASIAATVAMGAWLIVSRQQPTETFLELTTPSSSDPTSFAVSPDGFKIVYLASDGATSRLWLRALNEPVARVLSGTELATLPFWSPDNRSVGFFADGKLKRVDIAGGLVVTLADAPIGLGGSWNRDGVIIYAPNAIGPLLRVSANGGPPDTVLRTGDGRTGYRFPAFLPDGERFVVYTRATASLRGVYVGSLAGGEARRLFDSDTAAVVAHEHLLFARQSVLFAQRFTPGDPQIVGEPFSVSDRVATDIGGNWMAVSASANGNIVYRTGNAIGQRRLTWVDRGGKVLQSVGPPDNTTLQNPELSRDGTTLMLQRSVEAYQDVWQVDLGRGVFTRVTSDQASDQIPVWSADGQRVIFGSNRTGTYDLYERVLKGPADDKTLFASSQNKFPMSVSPDGRYLLYRNTNTNTNWDLWALPLTGERTPQAVATTPFQEMMGEFSPDGRWIAYQTNESGQYEIMVQSFPDPSMRVQASTNGGAQPRWGRDSTELFYVGLDSRLMSVTLKNSAGTLTPEAPTALFSIRMPGGPIPSPQKQQYVVARDGQRFLVNSLTDEAITSPLTIILNWKPRSAQ